MADPLALRVCTTPDRIALVDAGDGTTWGYDELDAAVQRRVDQLAGLGLGSGDHLGLLAETSVESVVLIHAAWRLGVRLVPLNVRHTASEIARQASQCDLDVLVSGEGVAIPRSALDEVPVVTVDRTVGQSGESTRKASELAGPVTSDPPEFGAGRGVQSLSSVEPVPTEPTTKELDAVVLMLATSGTTGEPNVVELTLGNLRASATASAFRLGVNRTDRWLVCLPTYHMGGLAPVFRTTLYGTTLVVQEGFDPEAIGETTHAHRITGVSLVPTQLERILDVGDPIAESVRTVLLGGAPAPRSLIDRCRADGVPVHPTYGLTETASQVATATPAQAFAHDGTVGQPLLDVTVTIVDGDLEPLAAGVRGEIVVSGPTVTPGYYGDPERTRSAFCPHGLRTGDLGYLDGEGRLWVTGRVTDRIVSGGENVSPAEVGDVLLDHPLVADGAVVGLPDTEWGERVAALVVPRTDRELDEESLVEYCRARLAGYKVPKAVVFDDRIPRTASGTVDRSAVRDRLRDAVGHR